MTRCLPALAWYSANSARGADDSPQWYRNILASRTVDFQIATQALRARWREPTGPEREQVWAFYGGMLPLLRHLSERTTRVIPLIMMKVIEPLAEFSEPDLTDQ
jgi:hypothetical protein